MHTFVRKKFALLSSTAGKMSKEQENHRHWGDYMSTKKRKLQDQFDAQQEGKESSIFTGISAFVNGYTDPGPDVLRRTMMRHGGTLHSYMTPGITHVVATNLCHTKQLKLKPTDKIVHPTWITDSVNAGKLLPDTDYLLYNRGKSIGKFLVKPAGDHANGAKVSPERAATLKTTDPNFLSTFYARSRLHFLSTWGQQMKEFVKNLREESCGVFAGRDALEEEESGSANAELGVNERVYMHIDMDCFFASVALRNKPELKGCPVVVTHSKGKGPVESDGNFVSFAEIASCSYEARRAGVSNGMLLGRAKELCPELVPVPYDFEGYHQVSKTLYQIVASYTLDLQAVSCDELYVEITDLCRSLRLDPVQIAGAMRRQIETETGCTASAGLGPNMLVARLATRKAKPNGQFYVNQTQVVQFMAEQMIKDLPGVGRQTEEKLRSKFGAIQTCADLQRQSLSNLVKEFGPKTGRNLFDAARGIDKREIILDSERKSVSCDVNYGIRLQTADDASTFLEGLSVEVENRLKTAFMVGHTISLRLLVRAQDAPVVPVKFMGCGKCDAHTRSSTLAVPTDNSTLIAKEAKLLFSNINPTVVDVRGIGLSVQKLESTNQSKPTAKVAPKGSILKFVSKNMKPTENDAAVDLDFLKAMPLDIRTEFGGNDNGDDQRQPSTSKTNTDSLLINEDISEPPRHQTSRINTDGRKKSIPTTRARAEPEEIKTFRGESTYEGVKELLRHWITFENDPSSADVTELCDYLSSVVGTGQWPTGYKVLRIMHHFAWRSKSDLWKAAYRRALNDSQAVFSAARGCPMIDLPLGPSSVQ